MNGSLYEKNLLRIPAVLIIQNDAKYCFFCQLLSELLPCNNSHLNRGSKYRQKSRELNNQCFDFSNGLKFSNATKTENLILNLHLFMKENFMKRKKFGDIN